MQRTPTLPRRLFGRSVIALSAIALLAAACSNGAEQAPIEEPAAVEEPAPVEESAPTQEETPAEEAEPEPPVDGPVGEDCSAQGAQIDVPELPDLPAEVIAARDFLIDAALRCDEQLLFTAMEESDLFTYSFGGGDDAIGYWWDLEDAGEQPFLRMVQVLATTPALAAGGEVVVWPQVTTGRDEHTTPEAWAELTWLSDAEIAAHQGETGYLDWRAGISTDGQWRFFVRGD